MATFTVSGNVIAVNARLQLVSVIGYQNGQSSPAVAVPTAIAYSDANGNYTFSNVAPGTYQILVDLIECTTAPYNTGYSYRNPQEVSVVASNLASVNFTPVLKNVANPSVNAF